MRGYNVVITGANTGLGKATAMKLASLGANILLLSKSIDKGKAAAEEIKKQVKEGAKQSNNEAAIEVLPLDLASLASIEKCADMIKQIVGNSGIDILVNNAGVMAIPTYTTTSDGFETQMGVNHLGHFALTSALLPLLQSSPAKQAAGKRAGRIVSVSSAAHQFGKLDFDNLLLSKPGTYQPWLAYGNSKLSNILFIKELNRFYNIVYATPKVLFDICPLDGCGRKVLISLPPYAIQGYVALN